MPWLVRYSPSSNDDPSTDRGGVDGAGSASDLLDRHAALVSALWELGTTGVAEQSTSLIAGFDRFDTAETAGKAAGRHGLVAEIEAVDNNWVRHDRVEVAVATPAGAEYFPVVAGAAFGHGGHPTTRLCLDLMSRVMVAREPGVATVGPGPRVLDLGTGSGVLAIAAQRLGATDITAADIDPVALESARYNAAVNGVDLQLIHGGIDDVAAAAGHPGVGFDLLVANVLLDVHEAVGLTAGGLVEPGGVLILAGFLTDQAERAAAAYRAGRPSLTISERAVAGDWCALALAEQPDAG